MDSDADKREFSSGRQRVRERHWRDLIYGIRERRDADNRPTGEPESAPGLPGVNVDAERLRLENLMRDGVASRLPRPSLHEVRRGPDPPCLLVRVPRSVAGLHMVADKGANRFYGRNSAGTYLLDVAEIRAGFLAAESAYERVRRFRAERVAQILAGNTPVPVPDGLVLALHACPIKRRRFVGAVP